MVYNLVGALVWTSSLVMAGYFLKIIFPDLMHYIEWIIVVLIAVTSIPIIRQFSKFKREKVS